MKNDVGLGEKIREKYLLIVNSNGGMKEYI